MNERLIRTTELCQRLSMGKDTAVAFMASLGVYPIPLGVGRGRGNFWLVSAVDAALTQKHTDSQKVKPYQRKRGRSCPAPSLAQMSVDEIFKLTHSPHLQ